MCESTNGLIAAVGTFDGIHRGHRALLGEVCREARREHRVPAVVTFTSHPLATLRPQRVPSILATTDLKRRLLEEAGIERVIYLDFCPALAAMTAEEFLAMLRERYDVRHLVLGFNTVMGSDRVGSLNDFEAIGRRIGMIVTQARELTLDGVSGKVCSSTVRHLVTAGRVSEAAEMLGRPYVLSGTVVHGKALGRQIGFPTANIEPRPSGQAIPAAGVYACRAEVENLGTRGAMVNIGSRPTVDDGNAVTIEAHLFDTDADIYGRHVELSFVSRLRDELRFPSIDHLRRQLEADSEAARTALTRP